MKSMQSNRRSVSLAGVLIALMVSATCGAAGDPVAGKEKSLTCQSCHGPDGNSPAPQFPTLAGQHADYLLHALKEYKSGARKNAIMAGMVAALSEADMENLAAFYASQTGLKDTPSKAFR